MVTATVVICTMTPPIKVLEDLKKQTFKDFEVIVASEKGIVKAMNLALEKAKGDIFVRVDDDVHLPESWLEELISPFKWHTVGGATGPTWVPKERRGHRDSIRMAEKPNWFLRWLFDNRTFAPAAVYKCGSVSYDSNYEERFEGKSGMFECDHLEGTNWAMRTSLLREIGGFDEAFNGVCEWYDTDAEQKIKKLGYKLIYNPKAFMYHLLEESDNYYERMDIFGRIENWLRFHRRHSKFHYKKLIWLTMMIGYALWPRYR